MFTVIFVVCSLKRMSIPSFILIGCCVSELHAHLCPYRNVWPEAVYCCFTRTTLFTNILVCLLCTSVHGFLSVHKVSELEVAITSPSFVALLLLVSEIAKYIA